MHDVTEMNIDDMNKTIHEKSPVLKEMEAAGQIKIVGALYDTSNGKVSWH